MAPPICRVEKLLMRPAAGSIYDGLGLVKVSHSVLSSDTQQRAVRNVPPGGGATGRRLDDAPRLLA